MLGQEGDLGGAAVAALGSAAVHLALLDSSLGPLLMVVMAAAWLPCAWHLWRSPTASVWRFTALVDAAMLVIHLQMLNGRNDHPMLARPR